MIALIKAILEKIKSLFVKKTLSVVKPVEQKVEQVVTDVKKDV